MNGLYGDARNHETPLEAARHALMPDRTDPYAFDLVARIDAFEQKVYRAGWWWGCICGAVGAAVINIACAIGWTTWAG